MAEQEHRSTPSTPTSWSNAELGPQKVVVIAPSPKKMGGSHSLSFAQRALAELIELDGDDEEVKEEPSTVAKMVAEITKVVVNEPESPTLEQAMAEAKHDADEDEPVADTKPTPVKKAQSAPQKAKPAKAKSFAVAAGAADTEGFTAVEKKQPKKKEKAAAAEAAPAGSKFREIGTAAKKEQVIFASKFTYAVRDILHLGNDAAEDGRVIASDPQLSLGADSRFIKMGARGRIDKQSPDRPNGTTWDEKNEVNLKTPGRDYRVVFIEKHPKMEAMEMVNRFIIRLMTDQCGPNVVTGLFTPNELELENPKARVIIVGPRLLIDDEVDGVTVESLIASKATLFAAPSVMKKLIASEFMVTCPTWYELIKDGPLIGKIMSVAVQSKLETQTRRKDVPNADAGKPPRPHKPKFRQVTSN